LQSRSLSFKYLKYEKIKRDRVRKVEIDDEVFAFVKRHAEPLVDSFNSALRRVLAARHGSLGARRPEPGIGAVADGGGRELPSGTPEALRQILEVVRLVRDGSDTRRGATQQVAARFGVTPQTVIDKYTRQLGMTAAQFDRLLGSERCEELQKLLQLNFPQHTRTVDRVLREGAPGPETARREHPLDVAERVFGRRHGFDLPLPRRGIAPRRPPLDFVDVQRDR
jgi:hypothetical protein